MTNIRRLMARLNPPVKQIPIGLDKSRFVGSSGSMRRALEQQGSYRATEKLEGGATVLGDLARGMPSPARIEGVSPTRGGFNQDAITPQDIAGALAFIRDPLAREIFCSIWWPDGALRARAELERFLHDRLVREQGERARALAIAKLELHLVQTNLDRYDTGKREEDGKRLLRPYQRARDRAQRRAWPALSPAYASIVSAVLVEIADPDHCAACAGRGFVMVGELAKRCGACVGEGTIATSDRERAESTGITLSAYQQRWKWPYEWLHRRCQKLERVAAATMRANLFEETEQVAA